MFHRERLASLLLAFACSINLWAANPALKDLTQALSEDAFDDAIPLLEQVVQAGTPEAALLDGFRYHLGLGVEIDDEKALQQVAKAAEAKLSEAASLMDWFGRIGLLDETDYPAAEKWQSRYKEWNARKPSSLIPDTLLIEKEGKHFINYPAISVWLRKKAFSGDPVAAYNLWVYMLEGRTGESNINSAIYWLTEAADRGNVTAAVRLASFYDMGLVVTENSILARKYLKIAAENGHVESQYELGQNLLSEGTVEEGLGWLESAAAQDNVDAIYRLGDIYANGEVVEKDSSKALEYFRKGAAMGNTRSMHRVAWMTFYGVGIEADTDRGLELFQKSIDAGNGFSAKVLSGIFIKGNGNIEADPEKALQLAEKAVELGEESAHNTIASIYGRGLAGEPDFEKAFFHYEILAREGYPESQVMVANMLRSGVGIKRDLEEAYDWYQLAAKEGNEEAIKQGYFMEALGWGTEASFESLVQFLEIVTKATPSQEMLDQFREFFDWDPEEAALEEFGPSDEEWQNEIVALLKEAPTSKAPSVFRRVVPEYPPLLRFFEIDETVNLVLSIDENGKVFAVEFEGNPLPQFAAAAETAMRKTRFLPAFQAGKPVKTKVRIPIPFKFMKDESQTEP